MDSISILILLTLWVTGFIPVYFTTRIILIGQRNADNKATLITVFWPVAIPLSLFYFMVTTRWRS